METKLLDFAEFKVDGDASGSFEGYASRFGTIDHGGDTIDHGAYKETLPGFLERGFLGWGHDWDNPIGYFTDAKELDDGLYVKGAFHSDPDAQVKRQRVRERIEAGKFVGLSIGYALKDAEFRTIDGKRVRALKSIDLHEVSLVSVPMERNSGLTRVKDALGSDIPDLFRSVKERFEIALQNDADGESFAESYVAQLREFSNSLDEIHPQLKEILARYARGEGTPAPVQADLAVVAEFERFKQLDARFRPLKLGV